MWQVIGQEKAITLLKRALNGGNLAHAYLFVGPPQVGKGTLALNLAQALNCLGEEPPCQQCLSCLRIGRGSHADVRIISLRSGEAGKRKLSVEIGIDDIREIQHASNFPPFEGKYKVFILDGAENMSAEASNCLLKVLEEPLPRVVFLLLTSEERRLLPTVISRCQRLELKPMPAIEMKQVLINVYEATPDKADLLARLSKGRLGWALETLKDTSWVKEREQVRDEFTSLLVGSWEERFHWATELAKLFDNERCSGEKKVEAWIAWWRDTMLVKSGCGEAVMNVDYLPVIKEISEQLTLTQIKDFTIKLEKLLWQIRQNVNVRMAAEALMLEMPRIAELRVEQECLK